MMVVGLHHGSRKLASRRTSYETKVYVSRLIPQEGLDIVLSACDAEVNADDTPLSHDELIDEG